MKLNKQQVEDLRAVITTGLHEEIRHAAEELGSGVCIKPLPETDAQEWERAKMDVLNGDAYDEDVEKFLLSSTGHVACAMLRLREALPPPPKYGRIIASVSLQVWDGEDVKTVDRLAVDVTASILALNWVELLDLRDAHASSDALPDVQGTLADMDFEGQFSVRVTGAVEDYLRRNNLPERENPTVATFNRREAHRKSREAV